MKRTTIIILAAVMIAAGLTTAGCGAANINLGKQDTGKVVAVIKTDPEDGDQAGETADKKQNTADFLGGTYRFSYDPEYFDPEYFGSDESDKEDALTIPFYKDGFQMAGSNVITITEIKDTDCRSVICKYMDQYGAEEDELRLNYIAGEDKPGYSYSTGELCAEGSELTTDSTFYAVPDGKNVILIEEFRTIGPDEETERFIDDKMVDVIGSFKLV